MTLQANTSGTSNIINNPTSDTYTDAMSLISVTNANKNLSMLPGLKQASSAAGGGLLGATGGGLIVYGACYCGLIAAGPLAIAGGVVVGAVLGFFGLKHGNKVGKQWDDEDNDFKALKQHMDSWRKETPSYLYHLNFYSDFLTIKNNKILTEKGKDRSKQNEKELRDRIKKILEQHFQYISVDREVLINETIDLLADRSLQVLPHFAYRIEILINKIPSAKIIYKQLRDKLNTINTKKDSILYTPYELCSKQLKGILYGETNVESDFCLSDFLEKINPIVITAGIGGLTPKEWTL